MSECRICKSSLHKIISFGKMPIANAFLEESQFSSEHFFELACGYCEKCFMFQLIDQPTPEIMFHDEYAFFSQTSKHMCNHFEGVANKLISLTREDPFIVEIGCNDGIMLKHVASKNIRHLGIEPSGNVAKIANSHGVSTVSEFFNSSTADTILSKNGTADIIYSANVMCHIPDIPDLALGVVNLLSDDGRLIFEDPYLGDILEKTSYDQIYDEHVYLFSLHSVSQAFGAVGLELINCEHLDTHGGSMRYTLAKSGVYPVSSNVRQYLDYERRLGVNRIDPYVEFRNNCERSKKALRQLLQQLKENGHKVAGYAATSKSTTILNYCGIDSSLIDYITDTTPIKQGKFSPGMHIPIVPATHFSESPPDYAFLFAWNHLKEIMAKESNFDGNWITHVPEVNIFQGELA